MASGFQHRRWRGLIVAVMLVAAAAVFPGRVVGQAAPPNPPTAAARPTAVAQPAAAAPLTSPRRQVVAFDFEERQRGNFEDLPMHWYAIGRSAKSPDATFMTRPLHDQMVNAPGFPLYTRVAFDTTHATSGKHSLHLGLNGGNVGAFVETSIIPATPGSDYVITASVRTHGLRYSRARLRAYFIDAQGSRIEGSDAHSQPIASDGHWVTASARLAGDFAKAASIGIQLEINQPLLAPGSALGDKSVTYQDITGGAWWDDVAVTQMPRVIVAIQSDVGIMRGRERPQLSLTIRDVPGHNLLADVSVFDQRHERVARRRQALTGEKPSLANWTPPLPRYGWYAAELTLYDQAVEPETQPAATPSAPELIEVGRARTTFLWLPDESNGNAPRRQPFIVDASGLDADHLALLPLLMRQALLGGTILSCWDATTESSHMPQRQKLLERTIEPLTMEQNGQVILSLWPLPPDVAALQTDDALGPLPLLLEHAPTWRIYLSPLLMRLGQQVRQWQMGPLGSGAAGERADLERVLQTIEADLASQTPDPQLVVPWLVTQPRAATNMAGRTFSIVLPSEIAPNDIAARLEPWRSGSPAAILLALNPLDPAQPPHQRADDLALRMLHAWEAEVAGMVLNHPWTLGPGRKPRLDPDITLGVWSGVAQRLAGRRVVGRLAVSEGVECMILDGPAGGMWVLWSQSVETADLQLDMFLGAAEPVAIDIWGNRSVVPLIDGKHRLTIPRSPVFVENVDARLALFRAAFTVDPPFVESVQKPQDLTLTLHNPWSRTISGDLTFTHPEGWRIEPQLSNFNLAAGASVQIPMQVSFPVGEVAGIKRLRARVNLLADRAYVFDVDARLELGLRNVGCKASLALEKDPASGRVTAVVTQEVTNHGKKAIALYAFAALADHPRQERPIARLEPGESVLRRFRFDDAAAALATHPVRTGLREAAGPAILNLLLTPQDVKPPAP